MKKYKVVGLMSGTSLDGLDIAFCEFSKTSKGWKYSIGAAKTVAYSEKMKAQLTGLMKVSAEEFCFVDAEYGRYLGKQLNLFLKKNKLKAALISSHGHTIFHQPSKGFTVQIGSGAGIYAETMIPVVSDFRSVDVQLKGQGAPLVPIGDQLLFPQYEFCLNLGGISNISFANKGKRIAYDISPVNIVLNELAKTKGLEYDKGGKLASRGVVNNDLLKTLNHLKFYSLPFPKSLGREWIDNEVFPLVNNFEISVEDKLATFCEHIAIQIANSVLSTLPKKSKKMPSLLATGGGAFNTFLIQRLSENLRGRVKVLVPDNKTVMFKEALIFAFLGTLRIHNKANSLKSVTGAEKDNIGGCLYGPFSAFS